MPTDLDVEVAALREQVAKLQKELDLERKKNDKTAAVVGAVQCMLIEYTKSTAIKMREHESRFAEMFMQEQQRFERMLQPDAKSSSTHKRRSSRSSGNLNEISSGGGGGGGGGNGSNSSGTSGSLVMRETVVDSSASPEPSRFGRKTAIDVADAEIPHAAQLSPAQQGGSSPLSSTADRVMQRAVSNPRVGLKPLAGALSSSNLEDLLSQRPSMIQLMEKGIMRKMYGSSTLIKQCDGFHLELGINEDLFAVAGEQDQVPLIEHSERHEHFYLTHFYNKEHMNFLGEDPEKGVVIVSLQTLDGNAKDDSQIAILRSREGDERFTFQGKMKKDKMWQTMGLSPNTKLKMSGAPPLKDALLSFEQCLINDNRTYKFGVLYRKGSQTEDEMFTNSTEDTSPDFETFLDGLGERIELQGWKNFRGGLDVKTNMTGTHSVFAKYNSFEIMFHVSTLLPHNPNDEQQLERKRHLGNDIVVLVYQDGTGESFDPSTIRSHFNFVFVVVARAEPKEVKQYLHLKELRARRQQRSRSNSRNRIVTDDNGKRWVQLGTPKSKPGIRARANTTGNTPADTRFHTISGRRGFDRDSIAASLSTGSTDDRDTGMSSGASLGDSGELDQEDAASSDETSADKTDECSGGGGGGGGAEGENGDEGDEQAATKEEKKEAPMSEESRIEKEVQEKVDEEYDADRLYLKISIAWKHGVSTFGPFLPNPPIFENGEQLKNFLLAKMINGERSATNAPAFADKLVRTREAQLNELVGKYAAERRRSLKLGRGIAFKSQAR
eukprot:TRINITY_DN564_c0_g2_i1.p1 TRINITY_DN564_c0_g2~~TRINITY_DN564_c0_g2_i1.p1  ORF type:complete len:780 (+),score=266.96 TRINITY_DN564_c0_g2_i1:358-2697(+)